MHQRYMQARNGRRAKENYRLEKSGGIARNFSHCLENKGSIKKRDTVTEIDRKQRGWIGEEEREESLSAPEENV